MLTHQVVLEGISGASGGRAAAPSILEYRGAPPKMRQPAVHFLCL